MKKIYIIQFNIQNSAILENRIKLLGSWTKYFSNNWMVVSLLSSRQIYEKLSVDFDKESFFIIEINPNNYYGMMDPKIWDWLTANK